MVDTIFLLCGLIPLVFGIGFLTKNRMMMISQNYFGKNHESLVSDFSPAQMPKASHTKGLVYLVFSTFVLMTYFKPTWLFNVFYIVRLITGYYFPQWYQSIETAKVIPTVWT